MTKCYIGETPSWIYDISRAKRPNTQEVECTNEDIQDFLCIKSWAICEIQQKINYILYASQLKLDYEEKN